MARSGVATGRTGEASVPDTRPALSVGFVLAESFTLSAFSLFVDQLRLAADEGDRSRPIRCRWAIMGSRAEPVRASCGVTVSRTGGFVDPRQLDYVAVVGGVLHRGPQVDEPTVAYLKAAAAAGVPLIGICTGSFVLCRAGLMVGRRCCVSWYHHHDFMAEFPHHKPVSDRLFVVDGDRITCSGGGGVADLATLLIGRHLGRVVAQKSRHVLLLDRARTASQAQPHPPLVEQVGDERVRRAMLLMEQHLATPLPIGDIADRLRLSTRQVERLFRSATGLQPAAIYRRLRLRYARWLLENTERSITDIALEAGFADGAHLSRQFKVAYGIPPSKARLGAGLPSDQAARAGQRLFG